MTENENGYVSLVRIPRKWFIIFVWTFPILIVANTLVDIVFDWTWKMTLGETLLTRMAVLMTLIVGWFFIVSHAWEGIMLGAAKMFKDKIRAEEREAVYKELYEELAQAAKEGKTLEQVLQAHNIGKNEKNNKRSASKRA